MLFPPLYAGDDTTIIGEQNGYGNIKKRKLLVLDEKVIIIDGVAPQ